MFKISIITINLDNHNGLLKTIKSIVNQTCSDFEFIIIDGGSKDGSKELIEQYSQELNYWISEPDNGIYNAMNKGINNAQGEYILFLNSGDELYNVFSIENALLYLDLNDLICFDLIFRNDQDVISNYPSSIGYSYLLKSSIGHPSTFIKKELFNKIRFDENLKIVSDWKFFLIIIFKYKATYKKVNRVLSIFYADGISSNIQNQLLIQEERNLVLKEYFGFFLFFLVQFEILKNSISSLKKKFLIK